MQTIPQTPEYCANHIADARMPCKPFCRRPDTVQTILRTPRYTDQTIFRTSGYCPKHSADAGYRPNHSTDARTLPKPFCRRPDTVQSFLRTPQYCPSHIADARIWCKPFRERLNTAQNHSADARILSKSFCGRLNTVDRICALQMSESNASFSTVCSIKHGYSTGRAMLTIYECMVYDAAMVYTSKAVSYVDTKVCQK